MQIEGRIKELQNVADTLKASGVDTFSLSSQKCLQKYEEALSSCQKICDTICNTGVLKKFVNVHAYKQQLQVLERQLEHACNNLQLALTTSLATQIRDLKLTAQGGVSGTVATTLHSAIGVYHGASASSKLPRPYRTEAPEVSLDKDLMVVRWADSQNIGLEVIRYEVQYDDERGAVVAGTPEQLQNADGGSIFSLPLGCPRIQLGRVYPVKVRAVNRQGPGEWSKEILARFNIGSPNRPRKPRLTVMSPTEVQIEVQRLTEKDENGSPVQECLVEYTCTSDAITSKWQALRYLIRNRGDSDLLVFAIEKLTPGSTYSFRVAMINEAGKSPPSFTNQVTTTQLTPGQPRDLHVSRNRTDVMIKVRWRPPDVNSHIVCKYEVQVRKEPTAKHPTLWKTFATIEADKTSATAHKLESNTKYNFRVRAIDNNDQPGEFTDAIKAETCYGGCIGAAVAAVTVSGVVRGSLTGATALSSDDET